MGGFDLASCTVSISKKPHEACPERLFRIMGTVNHPTSGEIASLRGYHITKRYSWKLAGDFAEIMDEESDELMHFSSDVFDSNFNVHSWIIDGGRRSGSGRWSKELNGGTVVYIEDITVKDEFRRHGVASKLLSELWSTTDIFPTYSIDEGPYVYCWPSCRSAEDEIAALAFFRKHGFRRVGLTPFLCYSRDPSHPSRNLAISDDPDLPSQPYPNPENMFPEHMAKVFPFHSAIMSEKGPEVVEIIKSAYAADPTSIHVPGPHGLTPIHIAAEELNVNAIRTLLELGVDEDLKNTLNRSRTTPLESLTDTLKSERRLAEALYGAWNGYKPEELAAEYLLKKASGFPLFASSQEEYITKRKLGCTCGECTDGWLSPRMRHRLSVHSIVQFDISMMNLDYIKRGASPQDYLDEIFMLQYIPEALHPRLNKGFCTDFLSMFRTMYDILETPGAVPDAKNLAANSGALLYTGKGGRAEYAIDAVLGVAQDQSPLGDNDFDEIHGEEIDQFPSCDNDLSFGLVRSKLGLDRRAKWGPYI